jgi:hypothetical protein
MGRHHLLHLRKKKLRDNNECPGLLFSSTLEKKNAKNDNEPFGSLSFFAIKEK